MTFAYNPIMKWNTNGLTDDNRSQLTVDNEVIENSSRMANGVLRKYYVTTKKNFSCTWDLVARTTSNTSDGKWGGDSIVNFYETTKVAFTMLLTHGDAAATETYSVVFTDFSHDIVKRGKVEYWNISATMSEV